MKKTTLSFQMAHGVIVLSIIITLIFFLLSSFAVFYHNKNATNGYRLRMIQQERNQLVSQIETLEMQIANLSSLSGKEEYTEEALEELSKKTKFIYLSSQ